MRLMPYMGRGAGADMMVFSLMGVGLVSLVWWGKPEPQTDLISDRAPGLHGVRLSFR